MTTSLRRHSLGGRRATARWTARAVRWPAAAMDRLGGWLQRLAPAGPTVVAITLLICIALADELSGPDVSFTLLYLAPIGFAAWFVSRWLGLAFSIVCACSSVLAEAWSRTVPLPSGVTAWNFAVQLGVFMAVATLITALKARLEAEQRLARTDPLTKIANRRAFMEMAALELERSRRTGQPLSVAYVDVDEFKAINDLYGHAEGDGVLAAVASTLRSETRTIDGVARLGGDEFGLLLVGTGGAPAEALVKRLRSALANRMSERGFGVGFSIGVCTFASPPRSLDEMLSRADQLMYEAKRSGKNLSQFEVVGSRSGRSSGLAAARDVGAGSHAGPHASPAGSAGSEDEREARTAAR